MSGRLVAAIKMTLMSESKPSISTRSWFRVCSRSSFPPPIPAPRCLPTASISSTKIIAGDEALACSKRSLTLEAPTPTNISTKSEPEIEKNGTPASPATALATKVFPVPGGPYKSTPLGILAPRALKRSGFLRKSFISSSSSRASSIPATSLNVVCDVSLVTILALDLPNCITFPPPACMDERRNQKINPMRMKGRSEPSNARYQGVFGTSSLYPSTITAFEIASITCAPRGAT